MNAREGGANRPGEPAGRARRSSRRRLAVAALLAFVAYNIVCFLHARSMLTFVTGGERTPSIEDLSFGRKIAVLLTGIRVPKPANFRNPAEEGLAFDTVRLPAGDRPALEVWSIAANKPRGTAFLLHGYADCKASTLPEAKAFHELGWNVWMLDFAGCGGSDGHSTSIGYHEAADVVRLLRAAEAAKLPRPYVLYGMSMGAAASVRAVAELGAKPDGLILASIFDRMTGAIGARFQAMGLPAWPSAQVLAFWGGVQQGMNGLAWNPADLAPNVRIPTLVLHGANDTRAPVAMASNIVAKLAGPTELALFTGAAHESLYRRDPARWREAVAPWLGRLAKPPLHPEGRGI